MHLRAFLSTTLLLCTALQTSGQSVYKCLGSGSTRRTLTNYDGYKFRLDMTPQGTSNLQSRMDCGIMIIGYSSSRWLITIDNISMAAYQAQFVLQDGGVGGRQLALINASGTAYRQIATNGSFYVRLTTQSGPAGLSTGVQMTIEHLGLGDCPSGWSGLSTSGGYCYGVPKMVGNLSYDEATKGCNLLAANLVMGNSDYDYISTKLSAVPIDSRVPYWVGMFQKDSDLKYLNTYNTLETISGYLCSSKSSCNCVVYQYKIFYLDNCNSRRPYICYMPRGGTSAYYDIASLVSTASTVITIVAIVLTVGFILCVLISLIIVLVCCTRRAAEARRNRRQHLASAVTTVAGGGAGVIGYPNPPATATLPPPYPMDAGAAAPPYTAYTNVAFDSHSNLHGAEEKPPSYNPEWTGQRVPA